ncbi:hypothetical protein O6P32_12695 [Phocaeicola sp. KGMB11183]|jgi:hypothetical protein|uniref:Uncharacterized protein n=1 Tax=Phocaeicola acetigenes TaxID=3016083 RepID=A0ABT4PKH0_9BACT|nr:hypothetical protein [Phocaeicola sp. KGMB11183]MCZ8373554.1 hypothetical protein [Phocaeicola sp. KGMB11183]
MGKYTISKRFISYGHYELMITDNEGNSRSIITGNVDLVTRLFSEWEEEREEAEKELVDLLEKP